MSDNPGALSQGGAPQPRKLHVEVCLASNSIANYEEIRQAVLREFPRGSVWHLGQFWNRDLQDNLLKQHVEEISIAAADESQYLTGDTMLFFQVDPRVHVFQLSEEIGMEDDEEEDGVPSFRDWVLPCREFHGMWESLCYDGDIKTRLLSYANSAMMFSEMNVRPQLITWNRVVLLHGPPGTGKTSLSKALAQKLSIRLAGRYPVSQLVEINAHSLFSKWFSESGKLVSRLFSRITEMVEDEQNMVFVLIDEVESLTSARKAAMSGSEPSDAIRAVNAILTQLDALKNRPNVMVFCTSNLCGAIDVAFIDRADMKCFIGPPSITARYHILWSCLSELRRVGLLSSDEDFPPGWGQPGCSGALNEPTRGSETMQANGAAESASQSSAQLLQVCRAAAGWSGRALRKLPFLTHARGALGPSTPVKHFLQMLLSTVLAEQEDINSLEQG